MSCPQSAEQILSLSFWAWAKNLSVSNRAKQEQILCEVYPSVRKSRSFAALRMTSGASALDFRNSAVVATVAVGPDPARICFLF